MTTQHYSGGCQCGATRYEVDADLDQTMTCNCSRCQRMGFVLTFAPRTAFTLVADGPVTEYRFHRKQIEHRFCSVCGVESYAFGEHPQMGPVVAVNVNCLDGVNPRELLSKHVDGASF